MPYIQPSRRQGVTFNAQTPGELNYQITRLVDNYIARNGLSYTTIDIVVGALECAKLEFYRRIAAPYEDRKIAENGDVYECHV